MRVLVTGATRGIGRALVAAYAARGDEATGTYRGTAPEATGWLALDVTDPAAHAALAARLEAPLDLLVCNAGVYPDKQERLADGFPASMWAEAFATNVTGVFFTVQALLPHLRAARGKVAIIASQMGSSGRAGGGSYIYRASKAAAVNLGRNLAVELAGDGIAVGVYHPGYVGTDMTGGRAAIGPAESARGLVQRFEMLDLASAGEFRAWNGDALPL